MELDQLDRKPRWRRKGRPRKAKAIPRLLSPATEEAITRFRKWKEPDEVLPGRFGLRVFLLRIRQGMTQQDLAARAGLSTSAIKKIEGGRSDDGVRLNNVFAIRRALGVTMAELVPG